MTNDAMRAIRFQVMWNRLLSVVEEQAQTLIRSAFSTSAREARYISAGVFDPTGRMLAQAATGTPGHINTMARAVGHFLQAFPIQTMQPGDVYVTNDPWKGTGHLHDLTMVTPTFHGGRLVALFAATTHLVDIGGIGLSPDGRQVFHEGLFIPILPLAQAGNINQWLITLVRENVREPVQVEGDIYALMACNETGGKRLIDMLREYGLDDLEALGAYILSESRRAVNEAIARLPKGTWHGAMRVDGYERPIDLVVAVSIAEDHILVDFEGTSGVSDFGINCPMCYTEAYATFGVMAAVAPGIPNNAGTLEAVRVIAPENTIVNAPRPCAVVSRSTTGQMLPDVVFNALHQALPERVPAEGTSNLWNLQLSAGHGVTGTLGGQTSSFTVTSFHSGGTGARPHQDGLAATPFPSFVRSVPVEITEAITPIVIWRKELRTDSGGAGRQRGGLGQTMEVTNREHAAFGIHGRFERVVNPARGRDGGMSGGRGRVSLGSGPELRPKGFQLVPAGDRLIIDMPGGGGYGPAEDRTPDKVARDVRLGYVTRESARRDYKVALTADGAVDAPATAALRAG